MNKIENLFHDYLDKVQRGFGETHRLTIIQDQMVGFIRRDKRKRRITKDLCDALIKEVRLGRYFFWDWNS